MLLSFSKVERKLGKENSTSTSLSNINLLLFYVHRFARAEHILSSVRLLTHFFLLPTSCLSFFSSVFSPLCCDWLVSWASDPPFRTFEPLKSKSRERKQYCRQENCATKSPRWFLYLRQLKHYKCFPLTLIPSSWNNTKSSNWYGFNIWKFHATSLIP